MASRLSHKGGRNKGLTVWVVLTETGEVVNEWEYPTESAAQAYCNMLNSLHAAWAAQREEDQL